MKITLAVLVAVSFGLAAGVLIEANTQALAVSRLTGTSYLQILRR